MSRRAALQIYSEKAAKGDGPTVRTDGYPTLLATLSAAPEGETIVHGVTFADAVYLVFTDPAGRNAWECCASVGWFGEDRRWKRRSPDSLMSEIRLRVLDESGRRSIEEELPSVGDRLQLMRGR